MSKEKLQLQENQTTIRGGVFLPIIKLCLKNGGSFKDKLASLEEPFASDKGGVATCTVISSITVKDVLEKYSIPEYITYGENGFWDSKDSAGLSFVASEKMEELNAQRSKRRAERKVKSDALLAAALAKRGGG